MLKPTKPCVESWIKPWIYIYIYIYIYTHIYFPLASHQPLTLSRLFPHLTPSLIPPTSLIFISIPTLCLRAPLFINLNSLLTYFRNGKMFHRNEYQNDNDGRESEEYPG